MRDYFAAKELGKVPGPMINDEQAMYDRLAAHCYRMADAMLRARGGVMGNPFDWLDRLYARSKVLAFAVALVILAVGTIALACLNQDGVAQPNPAHVYVGKVT